MNAKYVRIAVATIFSVLVTIAAFMMLRDGKMQEWTFVSTLCFALAAFVLISSIGDVLLLRFWNLEVKFRKVERVEASVKKLGAAIYEVIETQAHSLMLESYDDKAANVAMEKLKKLIS
jgi:hypothetical protein